MDAACTALATELPVEPAPMTTGLAITGWILAAVAPALSVQLNMSEVMVSPPVAAVKPT